MRYDEAARLYPWIEELYALVTGQLYDGATPDAAMMFAHVRIQSEIQPRHQKPVTEKLAAWAVQVWHRIQEAPEAPAAQPTLCRCCGSIETVGGICRWCGADCG